MMAKIQLKRELLDTFCVQAGDSVDHEEFVDSLLDKLNHWFATQGQSRTERLDEVLVQINGLRKHIYLLRNSLKSIDKSLEQVIVPLVKQIFYDTGEK